MDSLFRSISTVFDTPHDASPEPQRVDPDDPPSPVTDAEVPVPTLIPNWRYEEEERWAAEIEERRAAGERRRADGLLRPEDVRLKYSLKAAAQAAESRAQVDLEEALAQQRAASQENTTPQASRHRPLDSSAPEWWSKAEAAWKSCEANAAMGAAAVRLLAEPVGEQLRRRASQASSAVEAAVDAAVDAASAAPNAWPRRSRSAAPPAATSSEAQPRRQAQPEAEERARPAAKARAKAEAKDTVENDPQRPAEAAAVRVGSASLDGLQRPDEAAQLEALVDAATELGVANADAEPPPVAVVSPGSAWAEADAAGVADLRPELELAWPDAQPRRDVELAVRRRAEERVLQQQRRRQRRQQPASPPLSPVRHKELPAPPPQPQLPQPPEPQEPQHQEQLELTLAVEAKRAGATGLGEGQVHDRLWRPTADHYEALGVPRNATNGELKKAFHALSKQLHPDKNRNDTARAELAFRRVKDAYECLSDPARRAKYDRVLVARDRVLARKRAA